MFAAMFAPPNRRKMGKHTISQTGSSPEMALLPLLLGLLPGDLHGDLREASLS